MNAHDKARQYKRAVALHRMAGATATAATADPADEQRTVAATTGLCCPECHTVLHTRPRLRRDGRCTACRKQLQTHRRRQAPTRTRSLRRQAVDTDANDWGWV